MQAYLLEMRTLIGFHQMKNLPLDFVHSPAIKISSCLLFGSKIPDTIVWSANPNSPVLPGSTVQLTSEGKLELLNPNNSKVWVRPTNQAKPVCGAMNDNGNFVVLDEANNVIWQSFQEPTDTILPGQSLGTPSTLTSRLAPDDHRDGHFGLVLQEDGNLVLYYNAKVNGTIALPYWATETIKNNASYNFVYDVNGHIFLQDGVKIIYRFTENVAGLSQDFYHMARMDFNGIFAQYRYPKSCNCNCNGNWSVVHKIPTDICMAISPESSSGVCGFNSYSFIINGEPDCLCLENYSYLNRSDHYRGCRPNFQLPSCQPEGWEANQELVNFIQYDNMDWSPSNYDAPAGSSVDSHTCKQLCLNDCFCAVAVFDGKRCWKKKYPLSNGRKSSSLNKTTFVKVPMKEALVSVKERCKNHDKSTLLLVISVLLGSSVFLNFLLILAMSLAVFLYNKKLFNFSSVSSVSEGLF
ncbi:hypothetical protein GH714_031631 [Hevea brasiliensis]|uniref:Bulb-type lectin domain-containing protein n=1 Tax=Hevea brasiliensis TaxID=3981 RepID=A0A6A6N5F1_HEVBR|nr:hypothetical protein GH714_031631 [Hevea brasiliensis]